MLLLGFEDETGLEETVGFDEVVGFEDTTGLEEAVGFEELTDEEAGLESVIDGAEEVVDELADEVCSVDDISVEVIEEISEIRLSVYDEKSS